MISMELCASQGSAEWRLLHIRTPETSPYRLLDSLLGVIFPMGLGFPPLTIRTN